MRIARIRGIRSSVIWCCGVVAVLCLVSGLGACDRSDVRTHADATATALAPTPTIQARLAHILRGHTYGTATAMWDAERQVVVVVDALGSHTKLTSLPKIDIFQIEARIWTSEIHPLEVDVTVTGNHTDAHQKIQVMQLCKVRLTARTAAKLHWDELNWRTAWDDRVYDYQWENPAVEQVQG